MSIVKIKTLVSGSIVGNTLCTLKNTKHEGYIQKADWIESQMKNGLVVNLLNSEKDGDVGMIEYLPGDYAWRAVKAKDYMFIHCLFIAKKEYQKTGYGKMLIQSCIDDAKRKKFKGVATVTSKSSFLADKSIFEKMGFEQVDFIEPCYELMVLKFDKVKDPNFIRTELLKDYKDGLVIFTSNQCPFIAKAITEITQTAKDAGITPKIIHNDNHSSAQKCPVAYGCFGMLYNGKIVADHPISNGRFKNILKKDILGNK